MAREKNILVIGRHPDMLTKVIGLLNVNGYVASGALTNEEALEAFRTGSFAAVIVGGGVDTASRKLFHASFLEADPLVKIIDAHPQTVLQDLALALGGQ